MWQAPCPPALCLGYSLSQHGVDDGITKLEHLLFVQVEEVEELGVTEQKWKLDLVHYPQPQVVVEVNIEPGRTSPCNPPILPVCQFVLV